MALPERREPTHIMQIDVPLFEPAAEDADFDAFRDVLRLVLELSRATRAGVICDDPRVSMKVRADTTPEATIRLDDSTMDRMLDDLVVRAGGQRGFTFDGLRLARWDLKAVLDKHSTR